MTQVVTCSGNHKMFYQKIDRLTCSGRKQIIADFVWGSKKYLFPCSLHLQDQSLMLKLRGIEAGKKKEADRQSINPLRTEIERTGIEETGRTDVARRRKTMNRKWANQEAKKERLVLLSQQRRKRYTDTKRGTGLCLIRSWDILIITF